MCRLADENVMNRGSQEPDPFSSRQRLNVPQFSLQCDFGQQKYNE